MYVPTTLNRQTQYATFKKNPIVIPLQIATEGKTRLFFVSKIDF